MKNYLNNFTYRISEILIFSALLLFSANAISQQNIGRVIHASGKLVATNEGDSRVLTRGSRIEEGDVLNSGRTTRSQLRMVDGALISLRQNTQIRFDNYKYNAKDKSLSKSIFSLLKGGFNTISGLIGKQNKRNYRVNTPVSTIGIRGTHYGVTLCQNGDCNNDPSEPIEDGLYASVIDGEIFSENSAGYFVFSNDEYFHVADANSAPRSLIQAPGIIFGMNNSSEQQVISAMNETIAQQESNLKLGAMSHKRADQNNDAMSNLSYKPFFASADDIKSNAYMVASTPGNAMMFSFYDGNNIPQFQTLVDDDTTNNQFVMNAMAAADNLFIPVALRITFGAGPTTRELYMANSSYDDVGSITLAGTNIGWGRWTNNLYEVTDDGVDLAHSSPLHYVVAEKLTTPAQYGSMTGTFNYSTIGGTRATDLDGNVASSVANVKMGVDFTLQNIDTFTVKTKVGDNVYAAKLQPPSVAIATAMNTGMNLTSDTGCPNCGGQASLALVGRKAQGAITTYNIGDTSTNKVINGTAVLER